MKSWQVLKRFLNRRLLLSKEEDESETYREIEQGTKFSGYNLWILGFSMVIACIGLTTNSVAAVIGAMLISPLMGPIVGLAFALAINDMALKKKGFRNWLWMSAISLIASVLFFLISPFDDNTEALSSFQRATIFDILLAFFGGMAGFLGIIKREGTKVIAGVAVATACMPPLCTAGFGLAHLQFDMFLGGMYFYLINCLFIGMSTFLLARFTGFHLNKGYERFKKMHNFLWGFFIVAMIIPGLWIAVKKWEDEHKNTKQQVTDKERIKQLEIKVQQLDSVLQQIKKY